MPCTFPLNVTCVCGKRHTHVDRSEQYPLFRCAITTPVQKRIGLYCAHLSIPISIHIKDGYCLALASASHPIQSANEPSQASPLVFFCCDTDKMYLYIFMLLVVPPLLADSLLLFWHCLTSRDSRRVEWRRRSAPPVQKLRQLRRHSTTT